MCFPEEKDIRWLDTVFHSNKRLRREKSDPDRSTDKASGFESELFEIILVDGRPYYK